ncbi:MAG: gliding motility-associated C-terminal domain-containing protein [Bacteroidia bacterium]|nr:gliding motility-associated C-terminal domain-containing protein [Bacteroidia bacterium]
MVEEHPLAVMFSKILFIFVALCSLSFPLDLSGFVGGDDETSCLTYIPSAISPNGDGINDIFEVRHSCITAEIELGIYDSNGRMIYASVSSRPMWNGMTNGVPVPAGSYTWQLKYRNHLGNTVEKKGQLVLVR